MTCFLDLFAGIGGFALGAEWAGLRFDKHYFSEVDDYAIKVYARRFPDAIPLGDIRGITADKLPAGEWTIAGGFPCQDISVAGKGAGLAGARSGLWFEYARIIGELRPRFAIMENVGALTHRGLDAVLGSLSEIGYDAEWQDIRASDVGAPHRRERIWIIAYPNGKRRKPGCDTEREHEYNLSKEREASENIEQRNIGISRVGKVYATNVAYPDSEHGLRRPEPQQPASAGGQSRDQPARGGAAGTGIMEDALGTGAGSEGGAACADRRRGTGRDESALRQTHGENGSDRFEPASQATGSVAGPDETQRTRYGSAEPIEQEHAAIWRPGGGQEWWATEPDVGRVANGVPSRVDRLKCLGNSIVPQIAELIFREIKKW